LIAKCCGSGTFYSGSGSGSGSDFGKVSDPVPDLDPDLIHFSTDFSNKKLDTKSGLFNVRSSIIAYKVIIPIFDFYLEN
jgi:hypothetical protein